MRIAASVIALALLSSGAMAQRVPTLSVRGDDSGRQMPLRISQFTAEVFIAGSAASTTLTMVFENNQNRQLEGILNFPVGRGKTISRFAMDVNGKIREGVVVGRDKARDVFERIVARKVDPGLLSWVDGSNYQARVFPIPANGTKTIVVRYEELLAESGNSATYILPMNFGQVFDRFQVKVRFADPDTEIQNRGTRLLEFEAGVRPVVGSFDQRQFQPTRPAQVRFEVSSDCVVTAPRAGGGRHFFCRPRIPGGQRAKAKPRSLALLWDNSGSATLRDTARELAFLDAYLGSIGDVTVDLQVFAFKAAPVETFEIKGGDWKALRTRLKQLRPDGATSMGAVDWKGLKADEALLFSDGAGTLGSGEIEMPSIPVIPVLSYEIRAGDSLLERMAVASGGRTVSLYHSLESAMEQIVETPQRLFDLAGLGADKLEHLYPQGGSFDRHPLVAGVVAGEEEATLMLNFGNDQQDPRVRRIDIPAAAEEGDVDPELVSLVYQMWVRAKLDTLRERRRTKWREIADLELEAGLVTPDSSLLVLDFLNDYIRNRIPPPPSEPDMLASYRAAVPEEVPALAEDHYGEALNRWDAWYSHDYPWLEETNVRLAKHGAAYLRNLMRRHPDNATLRADYETLLPLLDRAAELKKQHLRLVGGEPAARRAWLVEAVALQNALEPIKQKYGAVYLKQLAALEHAFEYYVDVRRDERDWDGFGSGDDPFGGAAGGSSAADDPFSSEQVPRREGRSLTLGGHPAASIREAEAWSPEAPHLQAIRAATNETEFAARYFETRQLLARDPLFYVDAADLAAGRGFGAMAMGILSNLAELGLDDVRLLRMLAYRLETHGEHAEAKAVHEDVMRLLPQDAVATRDLALSHARVGDAQQAVDLLWSILSAPWGRELSEVVLADLRALVAADRDRKLKLPEGAGVLRKEFRVDLRAVMTWDTDAVEIDMIVVEPANGIIDSKHPSTLTGGARAGRTKGGFGPEEYLVRRALPGTYTIKARVRPGRKRGTLPAPSTVYLDIIKGFGTGKAERKRIARRVTTGDVEIATVQFAPEDTAEN